MKNFEISAYGVEEMNSQEMKSVDGGSAFVLLGLLLGIYLVVSFFQWRGAR